jgi:hypothetical protein
MKFIKPYLGTIIVTIMVIVALGMIKPYLPAAISQYI